LRARGDSCDWKGATCVLVDLGKGVAKRGNLGLHGVWRADRRSCHPLLRESSPPASERFSPDILRRLAPGSYPLVPSRQPHFTGYTAGIVVQVHGPCTCPKSIGRRVQENRALPCASAVPMNFPIVEARSGWELIEWMQRSGRRSRKAGTRSRLRPDTFRAQDRAQSGVWSTSLGATVPRYY